MALTVDGSAAGDPPLACPVAGCEGHYAHIGREVCMAVNDHTPGGER